MKTRVIAIISVIAFTAQPTFAQGKFGFVKKAAAWLSGGAAVGGAAYAVFKPKNVEAILATKIQKDLEANRDKFFHEVHPVGKAKSIKIHAVETFWKSENPKSLDDLEGFIVRYTIYWEGPIQKDGYTKLVSAFDGEIGRFVKIDVLETNGVQNSDIANGALAILDACLQAN